MINPIYIRVMNGLANRLRTIQSFYHFSLIKNRPLKICWAIGQGFSEDKFDDLFENKLDFISVEQYNKVSESCVNLEKLFTKDKDRPDNYILNKSLDYILSVINNEIFCYHGDSCLEYIFPGQFPLSSCSFLKNLIIKKDIEVKINRIFKKFTPYTVGVHVRRGDAWSSPWRSYYEVSTDHAFINLMRKELNKNPEANFFLATDCKSTQDLFLELFSEKIISNKEKNFFESVDFKENKPFQKDALMDMVLLSRTSRIIGSNWSSFSVIAAKMGGKNFSIAKE